MVATPAAPDSNEDLIASGLEAQSVATAAVSGATISWGQGDGLNGDVLRPDSLDDLTDILDRVEFEASIDSDSYLRNSQLESKIYAFDQDGNELFQRNSWNNASAGDAFSGDGGIFNSAVYTDSADITTISEPYSSTFVDSADTYSADSLTTSEPYSSTFVDSADTYFTSEQVFDFSAGYSTDAEYNEDLKYGWTQRDLLRQIGNSDMSMISSGGIIDNDGNTEDSTYLFIRPESLRNEGIINTNNSYSHEYNPQNNDFASLSENAPLALEINKEVINEIQEAIAESQINFDRHQIQSFTTDAGNSGDVTIRLSDYLDEDGQFDILALNTDHRFTLEISNDVAQKLNGSDRAWSNVQLRSDSNFDPNSNQYYLNLYAFDHEANPYDVGWSHAAPVIMHGDIDARDYVEDDGNGNSTIELFLNPINDLPSAVTDGQTSQITYYLSDVNAQFETIAGNWHGYLNGIELDQQLTNSIQSITLDFNGLDLAGVSEPLELSIAPTTTQIDLATFSDDFELVDFNHGNIDWGNYYAEYSLYNTIDNRHIGNFNINGDYQSDFGDYQTRIHGHVWDENDLYGDVSSRLTRLGISADTVNENGSVYLNFSHDQQNNTIDLSNIEGWGWGEEYRTNGGSGLLPSTIDLNWEQFADLEIINLENGIFDPYDTAQIYIDTYLDNGFRGDEAIAFTYALSNSYDDQALSQNAVLGDSVIHSSKYNLDIFAESLADDFRLEATDFTIDFNPLLFENISASDIRIDGVMPVANAVSIDNEAGTIRIAAASLSDLTGYDSYTGMWDRDLGDGIGAASQKLATISLDFSEYQIEALAKNPDGSLMISPLAFNIDANLDETTFSRNFTDDDGQLNREILTLDDLGGGVAVDGQDVTLYEAKINFEQLKDGLVIGTDRVIGADSSFTNLVRSGDLVTTTSEWLNVGNIQANNLTYYEIYNQNATLENADFSQTSVASGSFIDGVFVEDARESTILTTDIRITGAAGNVVDLCDGIVSIQAEGSEVFTNEGKGSSNLITFQGDLNYDGRVSMKDLAYLNAGAARQQLVTTVDQYGYTVEVASEASYARDVDADFSGKIDLADLSILDADWGKTLHTGDQQFQGSSDVSWTELDEQGDDSSWDNDSFKDQNEIETYDDYVGSLESPAASNVIGADGNTSANDGDSTSTYFQETI